MSKRIALTLFLLVFLLGGFFRFYEITETPPGLYPDEAMNGSNALEALDTGKFKWLYPENNGREGLFINIQALSLKLFGNEPWALRVVSAVIGTLTILGIYLLAKELSLLKSNFNSERSSTSIALLSSFFLATSFWHINFSRIGFRAILVPLLASLGTYFLLRGLRGGKIWNMILAGIFIGLGLHTYIAFRFVPFVLAVPIIWYLWKWWKDSRIKNICHPCLVVLFLFVTFVTALPIGYYFLQHPEDFLGRTGQVSIFSAESPLLEFAKSNIATLGMFFVRGDCNWRHNFNCQPELYWLVAIFFAVGILVAFKNFKSLPYLTLLAWLFFLSLPATLTREGLPHALRSIGMIPPVMILAGLGAWRTWEFIEKWLENQRQKWPNYWGQLERLKKELALLGILLLLLVPLATFRSYFVLWAHNPNTYFAFSADLLHLGQFLDGLPASTKKYVVVNLPGTEVRGIPMPAQTVMFATDTFREEKRQRKNITYLLPEDVQHRVLDMGGKTIIAILNGRDRQLLKTLRQKFPQLKVSAPGDFMILETE
jgi:4-amino-4-deoxy-L-arabinose transferase-like glycosyltransferase